MRRSIFISILVLLLLVMMNGVIGAISINDLVTIPTADVMGGDGLISGEVISNSTRIEAFFPLQPGLEVGGEVNFDEGKGSELGIKIKAAFVSESKQQPAIAAGIESKDLYLVASKNLAYGVRGHVGFGNGHFDGLFVGINTVINPVTVEINEGDKVKVSSSSLPPTNLMAEYVDHSINLGVRMNLQNNLYLDLGILDLSDFKAGFTYTF